MSEFEGEVKITPKSLEYEAQLDLIRETKIHNRLTRWLTCAIIVLAFFTWLSNRNSPGRYAISTVGDTFTSVYVLDTKTSQLWLRSGGRAVYYGTNKEAIEKNIKLIDEKTPKLKTPYSLEDIRNRRLKKEQLEGKKE